MNYIDTECYIIYLILLPKNFAEYQKNAKVALKFYQIIHKRSPKITKYFKISQSGETLPNLVTLFIWPNFHPKTMN